MNIYSAKDLYLRYGIDPEYRYCDSQGHLMTKAQALYNARCKYINGDLVQIMCCSAPIFNGDGFEPLRRDSPIVRGRSDPDPVNVARSRKRAISRLRDLIECNEWDYFVTLTFDGSLIDRADYGAIIRKVNTFLDNRVRRRSWRYIGVAEYHKKGNALHFHFLVSGDLKLVDSGTVLRPTGGRPVKVATAHRQGFLDDELKTVYNISDWILGFSTAIAVYGNRRALARYVGKYLTKSDSDKIGGRWFYHGGDLSEPQYKYYKLDFEQFVGDLEFDTDGGTFKVVYFD